jgi:hypothetical protein
VKNLNNQILDNQIGRRSKKLIEEKIRSRKGTGGNPSTETLSHGQLAGGAEGEYP